MAEIDERIVSMQFDNRQFENGVSTSISTIDKLKKALSFEKQEKAFDQLEHTANSISFSGLQNSLANIEKWVSPVGNHIVQVFDRAMNYVESKVANTWNAIFKEAPTDGFKEYELKMDSVQTIMASTGASIETVNEYLDQLNAYADRTIYSFSDMTSNIGKFTNAGVELDDAVKAIQGVSNVAALSGANAQQASHAMYNFAQALSSGSVKLVDWKSIATASMDTKEFKQELINSAVEIGTLVKQGEQFVSTTTDMNGKVSDLFDATHAFNESLSSQWMTTDVLIKTLKRYTDETTDVGKRAFKAATEVKTFSQLLDTLKEAMGSGWTESFQLIIGDFEEAKQVWSAFYEILGGIIDRTATVRNNLLKMWKDSGGRDKLFESFKTGLEELDRIHEMSLKTIFGDKYNKLIEKNSENLEGVSDALKDVTDAEIEAAKHIWYGPNTYGNGAIRKSKLEEEFGEDGARRVQQLLNDFYTKGQEFVKVEKEIDETTGEINDEIEEFKRSKFGSFLTSIVNTFKNLGKAVGNVIEVGGRLFKIFSASFVKELGFDKMAGDVESLSEWILHLSEKLLEFVKNQKNIYKIRDAFDAVMHVVNKLWDIFVGAIKAVKSGFDTIKEKISGLDKEIEKSERATRFFEALKKIFENFKVWLVDTKDAFIDFVTTFGDTEQGKKAIAVYEKFRDVIKDLGKKGLDWVTEKLEKLAEAGFKIPDFNDVMDRFLHLPAFVESLGEKFGLAKNSIFEFFASLDDEQSSGIPKIFGGMINLITDLFSKDSRERIAERVKNIWAGILDGISAISFSDVVGAANLLMLIRLVHEIVSTIQSFKKSAKGFKRSIIGVIDGLKDIETAFANSIKADMAVKIATAVGILAASIVALTLVDQDKMMTATAAIVLVLGALSLVIKAISKIASGTKIQTVDKEFSDNTLVSLGGLWLTLIGVATVIAAVVYGIKTLVDIFKEGDFLTNLGAIMAAYGTLILFLSTVAIFTAVMNKLAKDVDPKTLLGMAVLVSSFYILAQALKVVMEVVSNNDDWRDGILAVWGLTLAIIGLAVVSGKAKGGAMAGLGASLIVLAVGFAALIVPLAALMLLIKADGETFAKAIISMGAAIVVLVAASVLLEKFGGGGKSLIIMGAGMLLLSVGFLAISASMKSLSEHLGTLIKAMAIFVVVGLLSKIVGPSLITFAIGLDGIALAFLGFAASALLVVMAIGLLAKVIPDLANGIIQAADILGQNTHKIVEGVEAVVYGIGYAIMHAIPFIVNVVGMLVLGLLEGFRDGLKDMLTILIGILDTVVMFIGDVIDPLCDYLIKLLARLFNALAVAISGNSGPLAESIVNFVEALIALIGLVVEKLAYRLMNMMADLLDDWLIPGSDKLADTLRASSTTMEYEAQQAMTSVHSQISNSYNDLKEAGSYAFGGLREGASEEMSRTKDDVAKDYAALYGNKSELKETGENAAGSLMSGFGSEFDVSSLISNNLAAGNVSMFNGFEDMTSMCQQYGIDIPLNLQNEEGFEAAMAANNKSWNQEFKSNYPQTEAEGKEMSEEGANGAGSQTWRYARAAQNLCDTFLATMYKNKQRIFERGQELARSAAEGVEDELEIHSPSKRMIRDAGYMVLGFVKGLRDNQTMLDNSSEELGNAVVASFTSPLDHIAAILRGEEEYDPTIRPVLDLTNVREGAGEIGSLFADRSIELANINGRLNATNLANARAADISAQNGSKDVVAAIGLMRGDINALNETMANTELVMDSGAVVGAIKRPMDNALGRMNMLKGRRN